MTKTEAINLLDNLIGMVEDNQENDYDDALKMAIEALRPDGDTISRQAAIRIFTQLWDCIGTIMDRDEWEDICKTTANELPPAQPVNYGSTNLIDEKDVLDAIHKVIFSVIDTKSPLTVIDKQLL